MNTLTIADITIRQDDNGLWSLNDLHHASGGEAKHQPGFFVRREETQALLVELGNSANSQSLKTHEGRNGGTYACRELVIAYAAWINAAFHLKVLRVFLAVSTPVVQRALPPRPQPAYMREAWFAVLRYQASTTLNVALARALGIHPCTLSHVLNGTGGYGAGLCTERMARRVLRTFCGLRRAGGQARQLSLI